jgi:hypothetical protein
LGFSSLARSLRLSAIRHPGSRKRTFFDCVPANQEPLAPERWKNRQELPLRGEKGPVCILLSERTRRANDLFHGKRQSCRKDYHLVWRLLALTRDELPDRLVDLELSASCLARDFRRQLVLRKFHRLHPGNLADEAQTDRRISRRATDRRSATLLADLREGTKGKGRTYGLASLCLSYRFR